MNDPGFQRPGTLADVAAWSECLEHFGRNLRDWQHEIQRGGVSNRAEFTRRLGPVPALMQDRFALGDVADAMLAAYAEWLADQAGIPRPAWCADPRRVAQCPWFGSPLRGWLIANTPASFRHRNLFTLPEPVFTPRPGRPRVSPQHKKNRANARQRAYRDRVRELLQNARAQPSLYDSTR